MRVPLSLLFLLLSLLSATGQDASPSIAGYSSIQEALDANPGKILFVPPGDYPISRSIRIRTDRSGMTGSGRIIQSNPDAAIIEIKDTRDVSISNLTLTRAEGNMDSRQSGIAASGCDDLMLENLRVIDNHSPRYGISLTNCTASTIRDCLVRNYMVISIDDRTTSPNYGYAFNCIDGTGIWVTRSHGILIQGNRIIENRLLPTPEVQKQYNLGKLVKKTARGLLVSKETWDQGSVANWHQGSALVLGDPVSTYAIQILGNYVENAAQGFDIHADQVIVANNIINNAFMGMKAMHGARNVLITGNQFIRNDLWSIGLMPGAASHVAGAAGEANVDGGSVIANNIISDFGYGNAHWIWGDGRSPILFDRGQLPENPPLTDVIVEGNVVYDTGRDKVLIDGIPRIVPPRYAYAVVVSSCTAIPGPINIHFANNILHPGTKGVSNVQLSQ